MKSLADALPPEIAQKIHPDYRKNEAAYWAVRDQLLAQYQGQWIAFAEDAVLVAALNSLNVFLAVQESNRHPFIIRVGHESEPWYRIRRSSFAYDTAYPSAGCPAHGLTWAGQRFGRWLGKEVSGRMRPNHAHAKPWAWHPAEQGGPGAVCPAHVKPWTWHTAAVGACQWSDRQGYRRAVSSS